MWFLIVYRKEKTITLYSCMILLIAIVAFAGVYTLWTGIYFDTFGNQVMTNISPIPFIYTFLGFVFFFSPLKYAKLKSIDIPEFESKNFRTLLTVWIVISLAYILVKLGEASAAVAIGLDRVYEARHMDGEFLSEVVIDNPIIRKIKWIGGMVTNATCPVMMLYAMICIIKNKERIMAFLILALAFLPSFLHSIATGSRGSMVWSMFKLFFIIILTKDLLPVKFKKIIISVLGSVIAGVLFYSMAITVARVGESDAVSSILRYFGEPFPNMIFSYWDQVAQFPGGNRFFPDFLGFDKTAGFSSGEIHSYWSFYTGVPILNWKIMYIDCYIEFGKIGAFVMILLFSLPFSYYFKKKIIGLYNIPVLFFYYEMCDNSFTGFNAFSNVIITTITSILVLNFILKTFCANNKMHENSI